MSRPIIEMVRNKSRSVNTWHGSGLYFVEFGNVNKKEPDVPITSARYVGQSLA
jgi:hypothetical protein